VAHLAFCNKRDSQLLVVFRCEYTTTNASATTTEHATMAAARSKEWSQLNIFLPGKAALCSHDIQAEMGLDGC
jgi:hypothetical protein